MCEYAGRLIAWLDGELPQDEATNVAWHLAQCAECRRAVSAYEEISGAFLDCYEATATIRIRPSCLRWTPVFGIAGIAAAAAILLGLLFWRPAQVEQLSINPPSAVHAPAMAFQLTAATVVTRVPVRRRTSQVPRTAWTASEPAVEIAIPADAMFPPGAVPAGFNFVTEVSFAPDGSPQALRVWP